MDGQKFLDPKISVLISTFFRTVRALTLFGPDFFPTLKDRAGTMAHQHNSCISSQMKLKLGIICSLGEELVKLFIEVPRQRSWPTFTFLLENISWLIIKHCKVQKSAASVNG